MIYVIITIALSVTLLGYIVIAKKLGIVDKPNDRSSHKKSTVRGGGIIFPVAIMLWGLLFNHTDWNFIGAVLLLGTIGFLDDCYSLSQLSRLFIQSIGVFMVLIELEISMNSYIYAFIVFILITGWLNTFNFMDGINGISVLYAIAILIGVYAFKNLIPHIPYSLLNTILISLFLFGCVNVRKTALAFAGDVGSLSLGIILSYLVASLIITTGRWEFILFLSVYGVDSVLTILHRILLRQNIFEAHRTHLYQYLANELKLPHMNVSVLYFSVQMFIISGLYFLSADYWSLYAIIILLSLIITYITVKNKILALHPTVSITK